MRNAALGYWRKAMDAESRFSMLAQGHGFGKPTPNWRKARPLEGLAQGRSKDWCKAAPSPCLPSAHTFQKVLTYHPDLLKPHTPNNKLKELLRLTC